MRAEEAAPRDLRSRKATSRGSSGEDASIRDEYSDDVSSGGVSWQLWVVLAACFVLLPLIVSFGVDKHTSLDTPAATRDEDLDWFDRPQ